MSTVSPEPRSRQLPKVGRPQGVALARQVARVSHVVANHDVLCLEPERLEESPQAAIADVANVVNIEVGEHHVVEGCATNEFCDSGRHPPDFARGVPVCIAAIDEDRLPRRGTEKGAVCLADIEVPHYQQSLLRRGIRRKRPEGHGQQNHEHGSNAAISHRSQRTPPLW
jgi:hypothetical protein